MPILVSCEDTGNVVRSKRNQMPSPMIIIEAWSIVTENLRWETLQDWEITKEWTLQGEKCSNCWYHSMENDSFEVSSSCGPNWTSYLFSVIQVCKAKIYFLGIIPHYHGLLSQDTSCPLCKIKKICHTIIKQWQLLDITHYINLQRGQDCFQLF
jgi:hypothetical protein